MAGVVAHATIWRGLQPMDMMPLDPELIRPPLLAKRGIPSWSKFAKVSRFGAPLGGDAAANCCGGGDAPAN